MPTRVHNRFTESAAVSGRGYTLIEVMVIMGIVGVMAAVAIPGLQDSVERNARESAVQDVMTAVQLTRSEAVAGARNVSICRSTNQTSCAGGSGGADWNGGWIIFTDGGTAGTLGTGDTLLQVHGVGNNQSKITLKTSANGNFSGDYLQFDKDGFLRTSTTGAYFKFCDLDNITTKARAVWISNTGRSALAIKTGGTSNDIYNDLAGADLVCP